MKQWTCVIFCCIILWVHGAPAAKDRRVSRDLDKIDGLRARLLRLQNQIEAMESGEGASKTSEGGREKGSRAKTDDVSAENDVSQLREGSEALMTSAQQQRVQKLARTLGDDRESNLKALAETLTQMLREDKAEENPERSNTAGEYLGDGYIDSRHKTSSYATNRAAAEEEEEEEEEEDDDETDNNNDDKYDVEIDDARLRNIYNMLVRMYNEQQREAVAMDTRNRHQQHRYLPDSARPTSYHSVPVVHVGEGSFGDFVGYSADDSGSSEGRHSSSAPRAQTHGMRDAVLTAVETKLLNDVQDARAAGVSVDDIIKDIQKKAADELKRERLEEIERELSSLSRSRL